MLTTTSKSLMPLVIMAAQLIGCQSHGAPCSSITAFETRPSGTAWGSFEADASAGRCGPSAKAVAEYYEAVQAQVLPNSMTLVGMTPDEKVAREKERASAALSVIRTDASKGLWRLLNAMAMHPDDEVVVLTRGPRDLPKPASRHSDELVGRFGVIRGTPAGRAAAVARASPRRTGCYCRIRAQTACSTPC